MRRVRRQCAAPIRAKWWVQRGEAVLSDPQRRLGAFCDRESKRQEQQRTGPSRRLVSVRRAVQSLGTTVEMELVMDLRRL